MRFGGGLTIVCPLVYDYLADAERWFLPWRGAMV